MPKTSRIALLLALSILSVQAVAHAGTYTDTFEQTYAVAPGVELSLANTNGSVTVEVWDRDVVEVVAEKRVGARSRQDAQSVLDEIKIIVRESRERIEIDTEVPRNSSGVLGWLFGNSTSTSVRYTLRVPVDAALEIETVNGNVSTQGAGATQVLRSVNGRIEVEGALAGVDARTTNGGITVDLIETPPGIDIELASTNGGISLAVPGDLRARLEARTVNGSVKTDVPVTIEGRSSRRRLVGSFNGGNDGRIGIRTTNGSVRIRRST